MKTDLMCRGTMKPAHPLEKGKFVFVLADQMKQKQAARRLSRELFDFDVGIKLKREFRVIMEGFAVSSLRDKR